MIEADSFLLHKKSKTPPQKGGVFTGLGELRRSRTLSVGADECNEAAILPVGADECNEAAILTQTIES
ncbi:hypothetical protein CEQ51_27460 [Pseudomonas thivervalensis]|uniref:Uncharacterized protein n=1 Tax=Pseudomonas thivervalensis TaxID=86265 RepID=A0A176NLL2_9PSED|nr:hypothetical protein CE140_27465 [Pseudomonas thivervalensis]AXA63654.1 hypothetical protein CEQ51_27460 [Pseudomonas thivervalensis]OAB52028.1 hypothetical protein APS14_26790 [Pseudomonas thivervalensis]